MSTSTVSPGNPYIAGPAVRGIEFYGRADILRAVQEYLSLPRQNAVVLFGQRRIGKTSILFQLRDGILSEQFAPIYFDLMGKGNWTVESVKIVPLQSRENRTPGLA